MMKSCHYCGRVHDSKIDCGRKPVYKKKTTEKTSFRNSTAWKKKREEIKERDRYLCQVCLRNLYNTLKQYTYAGNSVHHAIGLDENIEKQLDNDNLITLCKFHHEMADDGLIPYKHIKRIIDEQEQVTYDIPPAMW